MAFARVEHAVFPLASSDTRIAVMVGLCGGTVTREEVEHLTLTDTVARPYRKPVVVEGVRYASVTEAATKLIERSKLRVSHDQYRTEHQRRVKMIARAANMPFSGIYWCA